MNLRKAGGTAAQAALQASSYRGMHTTQRRDSLMVKRWLKRAPEPSRAKQGTQTPGEILLHFSFQLPAFSSHARLLAHGRMRPAAIEAERQIQHPFERGGAGCH